MNHVPVVNRVLSRSPQSRHLFDALAAIPHFQSFGVQVDIHLFTDQAAVHRIGILADRDRTIPGYTRPDAMGMVESLQGEPS